MAKTVKKGGKKHVDSKNDSKRSNKEGKRSDGRK
jgi:hypothetical protein